MQLPMELTMQMAGAGLPLMAGPGNGASTPEGDVLAQAGQFSELLTQAIQQQAGPQAPAPGGVSMLALLQMNTAQAAIPGEAADPATASVAAQANPAPDLTQLLANNSPLAATVPVATPQPAVQPADPALVQIPQAANGDSAAPTLPDQTPQAAAAPAVPTEEILAKAEKPVAPIPAQVPILNPASDPAGSASEETLDPSTSREGSESGKTPDFAEAPAPQPASAPEIPLHAPVSMMELQIRAAVQTPVVASAPAQAQIAQAAGQPAPIKAEPVKPAPVAALQATASTEIFQPAAAPAAVPAMAAATEPLPAETASLPLPPPPQMETGASGGQDIPDLPALAVSVDPAGAEGGGSGETRTEPAQAALNTLPEATRTTPSQPASQRPAGLNLESLSASGHVEMPAEAPVEVVASSFAPADASGSAPSVVPVAAGNPSTPASLSAAPEAGSAPVFTPSAESLTDQVVEGTAYGAKNGQKELTIRLNPHNLGEVRVNLISRDIGNGATELSARLIATSAESHEALQQQINQLKDSLEVQGVRVDRLTVIMASGADTRNDARGGDSSGGQTFNQQQQAFQQQNPDQHLNRDSHPGFNLGGQGHEQAASGRSGQQGANRYASVPAGNGASSEISGGPESGANENGRISLLA